MRVKNIGITFSCCSALHRRDLALQFVAANAHDNLPDQAEKLQPILETECDYGSGAGLIVLVDSAAMKG
jgi:hypothetical protein